MYFNKEIIVNSEGQDPNQFQVKLPYNMAIHPNTEVAITKGDYRINNRINIDSTNDTFTLLWGQSNNEVPLPTAGNATCRFFPPQQYKLKHGLWNLRGSEGQVAGDSTEIGYNDRLLLNNLVDTLNDQNKFFTWQWTGINKAGLPRGSATNMQYGLQPYFANHVGGQMDFIGGNPFTGKLPTITQTAPVGGVSSGKTTLEAGAVGDGTCISITESPVCLVYSEDIIAAGNVDKPQVFFEATILTEAGLDRNMMMGGFIPEESYKYRNGNVYDPERDFVEIPRNMDGTYNYNSDLWKTNFAIYFEVDAEGNIKFHRKEYLSNGKLSDNPVETIDGGAVYDGSTQRVISMMPLMDINGSDCRLRMKLDVDGVNAGHFDLGVDDSYMKYAYRAVVINDSNADIEMRGLTKNNFSFDLPQTSASANAAGGQDNDSGTEIINLNWVYLGYRARTGTMIDMFPATVLNYETAKATLKNNARMFFDNEETPGYIFINGHDAKADYELIQLGDDLACVEPTFHICLENLPIENCIARNYKGMAQKRIYSEYGQETDASFKYSIHPRNLVYHKLHNKQTMMVDHLMIRVADTDNITYKGLVGTLCFNLHFRTNPHRMLQKLTGARGGQEIKLETHNDFEQINRMSERVF